MFVLCVEVQVFDVFMKTVSCAAVEL
jgi:hypothetical protein